MAHGVNGASREGAYAVSIHDVAPATWEACSRLLELLAPGAVAATLLVVPRYHGGPAADEVPGFGAELRARVAGGDEISLHGYLHRDDAGPPRGPLDWARRRLYTAAEGEFAALAEAEAARRLAAGLRCLTAMGLAVRSFVAPAWLLGPGSRRALAGTQLDYTASRDALIRIHDGSRVAAPSLVWSTRSAWRRRLSAQVNARRLQQHGASPLVRLALHPADAGHPEVLDAWREIIGTFKRTRRPMLEFDAFAGRGRLRGSAAG